MPLGVSEVVAFFVGGILFRYFEEIRDFIFKVQDDIQRVQRQHQKTLEDHYG